MEVIYESALHYKVIEASVNNLLPCLQISIVRPLTARYRAFSDGTIQGAGLTVKCVKKAPDSFTVTASWEIPTQRSKGEPLLLNEIDHYLLEYNGKTQQIQPDQTEYIINGLSKGALTIKLSTVDTDGLISIPAEVTTTIE